MTGEYSDLGSRLRLNEEKYCDMYSTAFKQPFQDALKSISEETKNTIDKSHMMVSQVQSKFLKDLVAMLRPNRVLEIGGFTGYSAVAMASALRPNSKITSLELEEKHIEVARRHVASANIQNLIEFRQGPALESLHELAKEKVQYDFIFMDADKGGYVRYFDAIMEHDMLSEQGVLLVDNVLFFGQVHKLVPECNVTKDTYAEGSKNTKKMAAKVHHFNEHVANDSRVECTILPIFDGITVIRKK
ncbi:O-methyltransferase MdmC [Choanephora cucurbitarum]|uniref:O-methyltransferase MdmC n=1 Tax=Choanephora cucurbitarum TaxID=101091 RepID=A0A1C7NNV8_9FUNG|nr:O-methyltransferase MdmC [Choanephora cucurbitarum]